MNAIPTDIKVLESIVIIPTVLYFLYTQLPKLFFAVDGDNKSNQKDESNGSSYTKLPSDIGIVTALWSVILLILFIVAEIRNGPLSFPLRLLALSLSISGMFIDNMTSRNIFHIATTSSWFGCFDIFVRGIATSADDTLYVSWGCILALFMTTSIIFRGYIGQNWQLESAPLMLIGFPFIMLYFWGLEIPICTFCSSRYFCEYSNVYNDLVEYFNLGDYHRFGGILLAIMCHYCFGKIMMFVINMDADAEDNNSDLPNVNASKTSDKNNPDKDLDIPLDLRHGNITLPDDVVEISEEEAMSIIQNGLLQFKSKRAL